jgi:phosphocarrier protein HPr
MSRTAEDDAWIRRTVDICNQRGLHARASAKFVKLASAYDCEIHVTRDGTTVNALSIMGLLMLGAGNGCGVEIAAQGQDAEAAVDALADLVARRFDEGE